MDYNDVFQKKSINQNIINAFEYINNEITEYNIDDSIIGIRSCAFAHCKSLKKIKFSNNLKYIDDNAFIGCEQLEFIELPSSLEIIRTDAFRNCKKLKTINIAKSECTLTIEDSVFSGCESLQGIDIKRPIQFNGKKIFQECKKLEYLDLQTCINTDISKLMFEKSGIKNIDMPDNIEEICDCAFMDCMNLEYINLNKVKKIGNAVFKNCINIKSIEFPSKLSHIGSEAFDNCINLSDIIDKSNISIIYPETFNGCSSLSIINFNNKVFAKNYSFNKCTLLSANNIYSCEKYANVIAPIINDFVEEKHIILSTAYETEYERNNEITDIILKDVNIIEKEAFQRMYELKNINLPECLYKIQEGAFYNCFKLEEIVIPKNVTIIPEECFYNCLNLKKVICKGKIKSIGKNAFFNCINLEEIHGIDFDDIMQHSTSFKKCQKLKI